MIFNNKINSLGAIIISGVIFILSIVFIFAPKKQMLETRGTIVEIEEWRDVDDNYQYTVYIDYRANGKKFEHAEFGSYNSSMKVGDKVVVLFDPKNPEHIESEGSDLVPYVTAAASGIVLVVFTIQRIRNKGEE